jgi:hypothetical protein
MPFYPSKVLRAKEHAPTLCSFSVFYLKLPIGVPQGVRSVSRPFIAIHPRRRVIFFKSYVSHTYIFDIVFFKLYLVFCIVTKFWGMGQHHVLG